MHCVVWPRIAWYGLVWHGMAWNGLVDLPWTDPQQPEEAILLIARGEWHGQPAAQPLGGL